MMSRPDMRANLSDWLAYLEALHHTEIDLGLERVRTVAERLGLHYPYTVITVGGTNGKGSVCAMLEAIILAGGYKIGTYTSPHLVDYNERIRVNGQLASDAQIIEQFNRIEEARESVSLSYFEFSTLAALLVFEQAGIDVAILEVGLGGRLDAVNIVDADCAIITSIDIDHSEYLGHTRDQIAYEKAHIFRPDRPAICTDPQPPQSLIDHARHIGADLWQFGQDFNYSGDRLQWAYGGRNQRRSALAYPALRGANQLLNACAALAALEALRTDIVIPQHAVRLGLSHAALPGRFQVEPGQPIVVLDVAHNPHAAAALGQNIANMPCSGKTYAIVGMLRDKDIVGTLEKMLPHIDYWFCTSLSGTRALNASELAQNVRDALQRVSADSEGTVSRASALNGAYGLSSASNIGRTTVDQKSDRPTVRPAMPDTMAKTEVAVEQFEDPVTAFDVARKRATVNDRILVFGSFATVGPVLDKLGRKNS